MSEEATRQHYKLATGKGLDSPPSRKGSPGFAKGGHVGGHKPMSHHHPAHSGHKHTK